MQPESPESAPPHAVALGTAGGPRWWGSGPGPRRSGIATAVVVGGAAYLVDCGQGAGEQLSRAGIPLRSLRGVFLTHLHSDHTVDLAALTVFGFMSMRSPRQRPVAILGPGNRGALPPVSPVADVAPRPAFPDNPTPGTAEMVTKLLQAYSTDLTDRMLDSLRPSPLSFFTASDIAVPQGIGYHPNDNPCPSGMEPFEVYRDELVRVTATLVRHPPVAPAFAFRFDTDGGSVTISGDTAYCENLVRLAEDTDLLMHEAIDFDWVERSYADEDPKVARAAKQHHHKSHSSPQQAGRVAAEAGARALALHHLVPGDADPSVWRGARDTYDGPVLVPDDLQVISFARAGSRVPQPVGEA
ncbi:MBL fold metallo-hydrolase [Amycolatopsis sp. Poz14]|uniref:MBL fold metallo-hydrolase n=1 Tax=Amycolatopsis sp. Poz14 TaxID=1447705 RepID=UPI001EE7D53F|nr:MBL fold metallo-hydrolase [Amycolatopsis sp. Poz14]MCG3756043.1 MBL fold metallo-hydrolase [Amycolatopsis sp. Poz14]